ncbi:hypothetical protein [Candidatus Clostridium stratigraminis]|uniref:Uncharacterized protein n=1 Tax=Candidatus Clostridium stratigraminis TaxID=3381661 RepID=A0ABW8T8P4_9CLOT
MILLLIFAIALLLIAVAFDSVVSYELLSYIFKKMRLGISLGKILNRKQLKAVLQLLLDEEDEYGIKESRINIFCFKWQFIPFYLVRRVLAHFIKDKELEKVNKCIFDKDVYEIGSYSEKNNFIEIYEFNLIRWCNENNINKKEYMIKVIFHEYRHKYQFKINMKLDEEELEDDAENFAENFFNKNIEQIIDLLYREDEKNENFKKCK